MAHPGTTDSATRDARVTLQPLFLAYALSITDRMILSVLFEPIRLESGATDTQMVLLRGLGAAGTCVGRLLFDRLLVRGGERGLPMITVVQVATVPFAVADYQADSFAVAVALFLFPAFAANFFLEPTLALIHQEVSANG